MNLIAFVVIWIALAVAVAGLAIYRMVVGTREEDSIHLGEGEAPVVGAQVKLFRKLESVERWGKALTVVTVLYGLAILAAYLYRAWQQSGKFPG